MNGLRGMSRTTTGEDRSFGIATGANINAQGGTSLFDAPPQDSFGLRVTSRQGDDDPYLYVQGEEYSVTFSDSSGTYTLQTARVLRSDRGPAQNSGVIVFEGTDQNGRLVQLLWAPGVDVQSWYEGNAALGNASGFFNSDQDPAYTHRFVCFTADTLIRCKQGLVAAGDLRVGSVVQTLDHGWQPLIWVGRKRVVGIGDNAPIAFAAGSLGNRSTLHLSQQHRVLWRSSMAELMFASSEVLVPAKALIGWCGVAAVPCVMVHYVHVMLERHEILNAGNGAACESLLAGDMVRQVVGDGMPDVVPAQRAVRPILSYREARHLTRCTAMMQLAPGWAAASG